MVDIYIYVYNYYWDSYSLIGMNLLPLGFDGISFTHGDIVVYNKYRRGPPR
jgi:hypothetical protein